MKFFMRVVLLGAFIFSIAGGAERVYAQKPAPEKPAADAKPSANPGSSSPAYAELVLKRTELRSELESLILDYTEEFPRIKELKFILALFDRDIGRINRVKPEDSSKLTLALGKLMLRRIELETELVNLQKNYKDEHPDVKRAKRKVEIYESAISDILN